jgi:hypothetical protein
MNEFTVLHIRKVKTVMGCMQVLKHNLRKKDNLDVFIDTDKSQFNFYRGATDEDFHAKYYELTANLVRKIQINASRIIEMVVSFSPKFGEGWEENNKLKKKIRRYFNATEVFLKHRYGYVIISRTDHFDEKTPHSHFLLVPICVTKDGRKKFSSSEFLGGRKGLFDLHDQFHSKVGWRFGLQRGVRENRTAHSDLKNFEAWEKSQRTKMKEKEADLEEQSNLLQKQQEEVEREKANIKSQKENLKKSDAILRKQSEKLRKLREKAARKAKEMEDQRKSFFDLTGQAMKNLARISKREKEYQEIEITQTQQIPQIPIPPASVTENSRVKWRDKVQQTVNDAFQKLTELALSFKAKYDSLREKYLNLNEQNENNKERAEKAENDLINKPIGEIIADRKKQQDKEQVKEKTDERNGKSRTI